MNKKLSKKYGLIENSSRGIWSLTQKGLETKTVNKDDIWASYKSDELDEEIEEDEKWKTDLLNAIMNISPSVFEGLCQRILRESGFEEVKVTGKSGEGGIDGEGIYKLGGFLRVEFQMKVRHSLEIPKTRQKEMELLQSI